MGEESEDTVGLSAASYQFLRRQVLLFQGFALGLAQQSGLQPDEAGQRFWQGVSRGGAPRSVNAGELERIAQMVAEDVELLYGEASVEHYGEGWRVAASISANDRATLERWGAPLEYVVAWLAEIQRHEGEGLWVDWTTTLEGNRLIQELIPRTLD